MRNATEVREFEILINGKDTERTELLVTPLECILGACAMTTVEESDLPSSSKPWSDPASWKSGAVPVEDEEVIIDSDMWIELDIAANILYIDNCAVIRLDRLFDGEAPFDFLVSILGLPIPDLHASLRGRHLY